MDEPLPEPPARASCGHVAAELLTEPATRGHFVQFYEDEQFLGDTVGHFFRAGLAAQDRLLLIAEPAHAQRILVALDPERARAALRSGQLTLVDARELLDTLLVDGMPDAAKFHTELERLLLLTRAFPGARLRAFGEMVNVLWCNGNVRAALRLEELWNEAGQVHEFSLLCAYCISDFCEQRDGVRFDQLCQLHTRVIPTEGFSRLDDAQGWREISMLQQRSRALESEIRQRQAAEAALREVLEKRTRVEAELRGSLEREHEAQARAQASEDFKQAFMGLLSGELQQPLNAILTTARLLTLRAELTTEGQKRLDRVVSSGVRMQRMLEQILDLARDHWTSGISVSRTPARDLLPLVAKIADELRLERPHLHIELRAAGRCMASVDADRFEQVAAHLLSNAVIHGDTTRPINVALTRQGWNVSLSVHNHGPPIAPEELALLFEPLRRLRKAERRSAGLGLGLYISQRVVRAHGGTLRVESNEELGTLFEATFPHHDPVGIS